MVLSRWKTTTAQIRTLYTNRNLSDFDTIIGFHYLIAFKFSGGIPTASTPVTTSPPKVSESPMKTRPDDPSLSPPAPQARNVKIFARFRLLPSFSFICQEFYCFRHI